MTLRTTPRIYDGSRDLFEQSVREGDNITQHTIEFDVMVQNTQSVLLQDTDKGVGMLEELAMQRQDFLKKYAIPKINKATSFTNIHRLVNSVEFAVERAIMPVLFASNTHDVQNLRKEFANGLEGSFVDLIEGELDSLRDIPIPQNIPVAEYKRHVRGAIQEDTVAALLNSSQNGQFVVLPSSLEEDLHYGTDLVAYFTDDSGHGFKQGISVKTGAKDAEAEKKRFPHLVVLCADHTDNHELSTAKLLTKQANGTPGLTDEENTKLRIATENVYLECLKQIAAIPGHPIPQVSSQAVKKIRRFAA
jgi:hypothetical protein